MLAKPLSTPSIQTAVGFGLRCVITVTSMNSAVWVLEDVEVVKVGVTLVLGASVVAGGDVDVLAVVVGVVVGIGVFVVDVGGSEGGGTLVLVEEATVEEDGA